MLREMQHAIDPSPGLRWSIEHWDQIQADLRERPRKRQRQHDRLAERIDAYDGLH